MAEGGGRFFPPKVSLRQSNNKIPNSPGEAPRPGELAKSGWERRQHRYWACYASRRAAPCQGWAREDLRSSCQPSKHVDTRELSRPLTQQRKWHGIPWQCFRGSHCPPTAWKHRGKVIWSQRASFLWRLFGKLFPTTLAKSNMTVSSTAPGMGGFVNLWAFATAGHLTWLFFRTLLTRRFWYWANICRLWSSLRVRSFSFLSLKLCKTNITLLF